MVTITRYGHEAHSVVVWNVNHKDKSRTVCYDEQEENEAINKFLHGHFGTMYDGCTICDIHGNVNKIITKEGGQYRKINTFHSTWRTSCTR